jgi:hypothetical protein
VARDVLYLVNNFGDARHTRLPSFPFSIGTGAEPVAKDEMFLRSGKILNAKNVKE